MKHKILKSNNPAAIIASLPPSYEFKIGRRGVTFLLKCLMIGRYDIVHALLDSQVNLEADMKMHVIMQWVIRLSKKDTLIKLLNHGFIVDTTIICYTIKLIKFKICKLILTNRPDTVLDEDIIKTILDYDMSPDNIPSHYKIYNKLCERTYKYINKVIKYYDDLDNWRLFTSILNDKHLVYHLIDTRPDYIKNLFKLYKDEMHDCLIEYIKYCDTPNYFIKITDYTYNNIFNSIYSTNMNFKNTVIYDLVINQGKLTNDIIYNHNIGLNIWSRKNYYLFYTLEMFILKYGPDEEKQKIYTKYNTPPKYEVCINSEDFIYYNRRSEVKYEEFYKSKFLFMILTKTQIIPQNKNLQIVAKILQMQPVILFDLIEKTWGLQAIHGYHKKLNFEY